MAIDAIIRFLNGGGVVALGVEPGGKFENVPRAVFNTISASLAAIFDDIDNTGGNLNSSESNGTRQNTMDLLST